MPDEDGTPAPPSPFAWLDAIIERGVKAHPAVNYGIAALAMVAVGGAIILVARNTAPTPDEIRNGVILFSVAIVLAIVFFLFSQTVDQKNVVSLWLNRVIAALLPLVVLGGIGWGGYAVMNESNCDLALFVKGERDTRCDDKAPTLEGAVLINGDIEFGVPDASVVARRNLTRALNPIMKTNETGDFVYTLSPSDIGAEFALYVSKAGLTSPGKQVIEIKEGMNWVTFKVPASAAVAEAAGVERVTVAAPKINPQQPKVDMQIDGMGYPAQPRPGQYAAPWFDGKDWKYDVFYCQSPVGDTVQSKQLAIQLQEILQSQNNVQQVRVRPWPVGKAGYKKPPLGVIVKTRKERTEVSDALIALWTPYLKTGERIEPDPVSTAFPNYISSVACRA